MEYVLSGMPQRHRATAALATLEEAVEHVPLLLLLPLLTSPAPSRRDTPLGLVRFPLAAAPKLPRSDWKRAGPEKASPRVRLDRAPRFASPLVRGATALLRLVTTLRTGHTSPDIVSRPQAPSMVPAAMAADRVCLCAPRPRRPSRVKEKKNALKKMKKCQTDLSLDMAVRVARSAAWLAWLCAMGCAGASTGGNGAETGVAVAPAEKGPDNHGVDYVVYRDMFPVALCQAFIAEAEASEWDVSPDSIDYATMYQIDLYNKGQIQHEKLWALLEPHTNRIKAWMGEHFPKFANSMDWVFLRKYSSDLERDGLQAHTDTNLHSMNLPLNSGSEFVDGDLFFIRHDSEVGKMGLNGDLGSNHPAVRYSNVPLVSEVGDNTSTYFYPYLEAGSALVHDNRIWHGITRVTQGTKYSLLFFFDEPKQNSRDDDTLNVVFLNDWDRPLKLYWLAQNGDKVEVESHWAPGRRSGHQTSAYHRFAAYEGDPEVVEPVMTFTMPDPRFNEEFKDPSYGTAGSPIVFTLTPADPTFRGGNGDAAADEAVTNKDIPKVVGEGVGEDVSDAVEAETDTREPIVVLGIEWRQYLEQPDGSPNFYFIGPLAAGMLLLGLFQIFLIRKLDAINAPPRGVGGDGVVDAKRVASVSEKPAQAKKDD